MRYKVETHTFQHSRVIFWPDLHKLHTQGRVILATTYVFTPGQATAIVQAVKMGLPLPDEMTVRASWEKQGEKDTFTFIPPSEPEPEVLMKFLPQKVDQKLRHKRTIVKPLSHRGEGLPALSDGKPKKQRPAKPTEKKKEKKSCPRKK